MLQVSEHLPQVVDVYIYIYIYAYVYVFGLVACGLVASQPPMDADRLPVGMVAFGSVACRTSRTGCLWLGSMYNYNTLFHIYIHTHVHVYTNMYTTYTHIFMYLNRGI